MCTGENDLNTLSISFFKRRKKIPGLDYQTLLRKTKTGPRRRWKSSVDIQFRVKNTRIRVDGA